MLIRSTWTLTVVEPTTLPYSYGLELIKNLHQRSQLIIDNEATFSPIELRLKRLLPFYE
jgi:CRISPR-associated endoribonuclease Cas6